MDSIQQVYILILGGVGGALSTFLLQKYGVSAVVASCVVGLVGALLSHYLKLPHLSLVIFAGTFVGMTSIALGNTPLIILGGILTGVIYALSLKWVPDFGGKLGTIAFISTLIAFAVVYLVKGKT